MKVRIPSPSGSFRRFKAWAENHGVTDLVAEAIAILVLAMGLYAFFA